MKNKTPKQVSQVLERKVFAGHDFEKEEKNNSITFVRLSVLYNYDSFIFTNI